MANKLNEGSEFTIPLKNLLTLIAVTGIAVWGYFGITERLTFIERELSTHWEEIEENDDWIDKWTPPASVQQTTKDVQKLKTQVQLLEYKIGQLDSK